MKNQNEKVLTTDDIKDIDTAQDWVWDNINSGKLAQWFSGGNAARLLSSYVGKTVSEIETAFISRVS